MGVSPNKRPGVGLGHKPFQPAPGHDFGPIDDVEAQTRDFLAKAIVVAAGVALATTGVYGLFTGNFNIVIAVWAVAGPLVGGVVTYYFGPQRNDTG